MKSERNYLLQPQWYMQMLSLSLFSSSLQSYYGSQLREAPPTLPHHHQSSISAIHSAVQGATDLTLVRQDSPDSGFGNGDHQNSPLNSQNSPLVAQQHSPVAVSQQHSPLATQQNSPLMSQQNSPLGSDHQQMQGLHSAISTCSLSKSEC